MDESQIKHALAATYDEQAAAYERAAVPVYRNIARRLLQLVDLRPGWQVLDAGTGTGLVALLGAPRVGKNGKILGIDGSQKMLEIARQKAVQFGFTQCEFREGDIQALDLPDGGMDACLSQFALHYGAPDKALAELGRVLKQGGTLALQEWADSPWTPHQLVYDTLDKYRIEEPVETRALLTELTRRSAEFRRRTASPEAIVPLAEQAGLTQVQAQIENHAMRVASADAFLELAQAGLLVHVQLAAMPEPRRIEFLNDARTALQGVQTRQGIEWEYRVLSLVARK